MTRSERFERAFINSLAAADVVYLGRGCHSYRCERKDKGVCGV